MTNNELLTEIQFLRDRVSEIAKEKIEIETKYSNMLAVAASRIQDLERQIRMTREDLESGIKVQPTAPAAESSTHWCV